jgi:hypothetical protein
MSHTSADVDGEDAGEMEWNDHLQERLDELDRDGADPRPWREAIEELRERLRGRHGRSQAEA